MKKTRQELIDELCIISAELEARDISANSIFEKYNGTSYVDLCDKGIKLFEELKKSEIDE